MTRVLLAGLGRIARTHLAVLDRLPDVEVVVGVDPAPAYDVPFPVVASLADVDGAGRPGGAGDADRHPRAGWRPRRWRSPTAWCCRRSPSRRTVADLDALDPARVRVAHHFAFSPEVEWAARLVAAHPEWGPPTHVVAMSTDRYGELPAAQRASLVSSFVDSAPNQLSVVSAFTEDWRVTSHADRGDRAVTTLAHRGGTTVLSSNWLAGDSSKHTTLEFLGGEVRVHVEHSSMTVLVTEGDRVTSHTAYADGVERKEAHYLGLYDALLHRPDDPRLGVPLAARVARLLEEAAALPPADVAWDAVGA